LISKFYLCISYSNFYFSFGSSNSSDVGTIHIHSYPTLSVRRASAFLIAELPPKCIRSAPTSTFHVPFTTPLGFYKDIMAPTDRLNQVNRHLNYPAGMLAGQVAIITGAGQGIGAEAARLFANEGAKVVVADIDSSMYHTV